MKILTIVVPSYNVEKYLEKTLDSFVLKYGMEKLEVLIVNDGSLDNTAEIAHRYVEQYPETFFLINKENGGHGSTVNVGIEKACGKYFRIVDGDDWVDAFALQRMIENLEKIDVDLVLTNFRTYNMDTDEEKEFSYDKVEYNKVLSPKEVLQSGVTLPMTSVCYRTDILKQNNIKLQEGIYYVDEEYNVMPFAYTQTIYFMDIILYNYRIGNVNQSINMKNQVLRVEHKLKVAKRLVSFVESVQMNEDNKEYCYRKVQGVITSIYLVMMIYAQDRKKANEIVKEVEAFVKCNSLVLWKRTQKKYQIFRILGMMPCREHVYMSIKRIKRLLGKERGIDYV